MVEVMHKRHAAKRIRALSWVQTLGAILVLTACGGGGDSLLESAHEPAGEASASITVGIEAAALPAEAGGQLAEPAFHLAPVVLDEPDDADAVDNAASARAVPHTQTFPAGAEAIQTRGLTVQGLLQGQRARVLAAARVPGDGTAAPLATGGAATTYTPAQIRAAYGLPALPAAGVTPTAAQAAQLGAGQTIYIVDAMHNPNVAAELSAFNQKFGLPACTAKAIPTTSALPLAPAVAGAGCTLSVVYSKPGGGMTTAAPAYDAGWATEIALDVQWAHATAPLARIVLIESADASLNGLLGAVRLANAMGSGAVSMSFGALEGNWTASVDAAFTAPGMTYLAATGDSGSAVSWPAVSPNVLAVGGTSLTYGGSGARAETSWSRTGGGISAWTATPDYQSNKAPGVGTLARRAVADVAFNADPSTGQFVAVIPGGSNAVNWMSAGGTSLSTPQWAGVVAVANAMRAQGSKPLLGGAHAMLYAQVASVPGTYAAAFADVSTGANGTCATCAAKAGYDVPTGLGTPNVSALLSALNGLAPAPAAPTVNGAVVSGKSGLALSFSVNSTAVNPVTYSIANAPTGMVIATTGLVTWPKPVAGTYAVTATVKDSKTALSGQAVYTVKIDAAPVAPIVSAATVDGRAGAPLSYSVAVTAGSANAFALKNAPAGMAVSSTGVVSWASPVAGTYAVTVTATNTASGLSGSAVLTVVIAKAQPPVITAAALTGVAGKSLSGSIAVSSPNGSAMSVTISGVPSGVSFSVSGQTLVLYWAKPVTGKYALAITAKDSAGLTTQATLPITINAK
jgi:subtilase family serine protease